MRKIGARLCLLLLACFTVKAASPVRFEGVPVELTVSQVSDSTVRVQLAPLDEQGNPQTEIPSPALVPFPEVRLDRVREFSGLQTLRAGNFRIVVQPSPLTVSVRRRDGTLVQELTFASDGGTNAIIFHTGAAV